MDEVRQHPFFTMHQIPGSLPPSCTVSAPIWSTDEFGELNAIKPKSALEINVSNKPKSSSKPALVNKVASVDGNSQGLKRLDSVASKLKSGSNGKAGAKKAASTKPASAGGAFNIFNDANDQVECKLDSQSNAISTDAQSNQPVVSKLTEQMASCGFDDEARDMPSGSTPSLPALSLSPAAPSPEAQSSDPKQITPPRQEAAATSPSSQSDDLHELAMMHSRLEECLTNYEQIQNGGDKVECPLKGGEVWGAKKWVTRYVDYTSKYGLGFLLNDGSSGVYFNDSTKAVHSATGDNFVYVERRKTGADSGVREPVSMYTVTNFPEETLKKKVTLLQHFRSYLLEQQKRAEESGEAEPLTCNNFEEREDSSTSNTSDSDEAAPMVFMKKWIKTKHAMLFRLSNGTVQVLFYDMTEVLISSEGNLITFVDKEKNRFVHSIAEIANKQHGDVSRRLKYAKEILSQLISASKR